MNDTSFKKLTCNNNNKCEHLNALYGDNTTKLLVNSDNKTISYVSTDGHVARGRHITSCFAILNNNNPFDSNHTFLEYDPKYYQLFIINKYKDLKQFVKTNYTGMYLFGCMCLNL